MRCALLVVACCAVPVTHADPVTDALLAPTQPETNTYFGTDLIDEYQYMEAGAHDPDVMSWVEAQSQFTQDWINAYPHYDSIAKRVEELKFNPSASWWNLKAVGDELFAMKEQPPRELPFIVVMSDPMDLATETILFDPTEYDDTSSHAIDFFVPSHDGKLVAISLSKDGTEDGTLRIWDRAAGAFMSDEIPRVNGGTAGGDISWLPDNSGFTYTRYPYPGERPDEDLFFYQTMWFHTLGEPIENDTYVLGESFPRIGEIEFETSADGQVVVADVSDGDGGFYEYWIQVNGGEWQKLAELDDLLVKVRIGEDGAVYVLSRNDAPRRKLLRLTRDNPTLDAATVVVPEGEHAIDNFAVGKDGTIYVSEIRGGPSVMRSYDPSGTPVAVIGEGDIASCRFPSPFGDGVLFRRESYTESKSWHFLRSGAEKTERTAMVSQAPIDFSDVVVKREFASADDGTQIPINIMYLKSTTITGDTPTLLYSYGSYGISQHPRYSATRRAWLEQGCIFANANIRGGGEYGEDWHRQANLENKKVSVDDMAACAKHLVDAGYTQPERLAIEGGSAGGLLVYGVAVHYPERVAAVVSHVGIADGLRVERSPNGEFNITEFGTVNDETQFRGMLALSPYHHVKANVDYPAVMSLTGINDPRVEPWQPFKMTARMQAAGGSNPTLLRVSMGAGHGRGTTLTAGASKTADVNAFLFERLGVDYQPPEPRAD